MPQLSGFVPQTPKALPVTSLDKLKTRRKVVDIQQVPKIDPVQVCPKLLGPHCPLKDTRTPLGVAELDKDVDDAMRLEAAVGEDREGGTAGDDGDAVIAVGELDAKALDGEMESPTDDKLNVNCDAGGEDDTAAEDGPLLEDVTSLDDDGALVGAIEELEVARTDTQKLVQP
jgi:hypothetical protein